jgi:Uma2 family endonuclease
VVQPLQTSPPILTAVDLLERFGPMPLYRVRNEPMPGTATEADVVDLDVHHDRFCELVDGILIQKTGYLYDAYLSGKLSSMILRFVHEPNLGIVLGAGGMVRLAPGLIRIPDVSYFSWRKFPDGRVPRTDFADVSPDLVVEIINRDNTRQEMQQKLDEYFRFGVEVVWHIDSDERHATVFRSPNESTFVAENESLDGGHVLPGFSFSLKDFFILGGPRDE